jgi:DNA polymerase III delta subunit
MRQPKITISQASENLNISIDTLRRWEKKGLIKAVVAIAGADADIKGAAADPVYALERAIMTVCSARGAR